MLGTLCLVLFPLLILAGGAFAAWWFLFRAAGLGDDLKYMPSGSKFIASAKVEELLTSAVLGRISLEKEYPQLEEGEKAANKNAPLNLTDIERITVVPTRRARRW